MSKRLVLIAGNSLTVLFMYSCFNLFFICLLSLSDGLVVVGVHSAKFPNEKVILYIILYHFYLCVDFSLKSCV